MALVCPYFWLGLFIVPVICLIPNVFWKSIKNTHSRSLLEETRELESRKLREADVSHVFRKRATLGSVQISLPHPCEVILRNNSVDLNAPHGYAFSQTEDSVITQEELVRCYDTTQMDSKIWGKSSSSILGDEDN